MSVTLNCAKTDPSINSTSECTILWGCTTTSTCLIGKPKSQWASIISKPLLNMVAESIVIFCPIDHVGCFNACAKVTFSIAWALLCRKGPPDAVKMTFRTSFSFAPTRHWKMALCSLSTGNTCFFLFFASAITADPAKTKISLLATARSFPLRNAARAGAKPAVPTMATKTMSASVSSTIRANPSAPG